MQVLWCCDGETRPVPAVKQLSNLNLQKLSVLARYCGPFFSKVQFSKTLTLALPKEALPMPAHPIYLSNWEEHFPTLTHSMALREMTWFIIWISNTTCFSKEHPVITIKVCLRGSRKVLISQKLKRWSLQYLRALGAYLPAVLTPDKSSLRSPSTSNPFSICILVSPARGGYFALFLLELMSTNCANVESCAPASSLSCLPGQGDNTMESMSSHIEHLFPYFSQFTLLSLDGEHNGVWLHVQSQNIIFNWLQQLF